MRRLLLFIWPHNYGVTGVEESYFTLFPARWLKFESLYHRGVSRGKKTRRQLDPFLCHSPKAEGIWNETSAQEKINTNCQSLSHTVRQTRTVSILDAAIKDAVYTVGP